MKNKLTIISFVLTATASSLAVSEVKFVPPEMESVDLQSYSIGTINQQDVPKELKDMAKKQNDELRKNGYYKADSGSLTNVDANANLPKPPPSAGKQKYALKISEPDLNLFPGAKLMFSEAMGGATEKGWTGIARIYNIPGIGNVQFEDVDYILSQGNFSLMQEFINTDINGWPAAFSVAKENEKKWQSELYWGTDNKAYSLITSKKIKKGDKMYNF